MFLAIRNELRCKPVSLCADHCDIEYAAVEVLTNNCGKVLIAVFYRPPNASIDWTSQFTRILDSCTYNKAVILGDFNFPSINWIEGSGFCESANSALFNFCQSLNDNNYFQLVDVPYAWSQLS